MSKFVTREHEIYSPVDLICESRYTQQLKKAETLHCASVGRSGWKLYVFSIVYIIFWCIISFIDPPLGRFGEILPEVVILSCTSGNISPSLPRYRSINSKSIIAVSLIIKANAANKASITN